MASHKPPRPRKQHPRKNAIAIGNRTISLEDYLAPPRSKSVEVSKSIHRGTEEHEKQSTESSDTAGTIAPHSFTSARKLRSGQSQGSSRHLRDNLQASLKTQKTLPIWNYQDHIREALHGSENEVLVLIGETGSGKSTQVPQILYKEPWCKRHKVRVRENSDEVTVGGNIAITQPRRVAATTLAQRVSEEVGTPLSNHSYEGLVGYSVRFDHKIPKGAKIRFLTEGTLLQELLRDPFLRQYSAVIVDEVHERSIDVDLLLGFLKQILTAGASVRGGVPLKVVIMSATADVEAVKSFFEGSLADASVRESLHVLHIQGRQFPVQVSHEAQAIADVQDSLVKRIFKIHAEEPLPGDVLAFLSGQEEIEAAKKSIEEHATTLPSNLPKIKVLPLYGQLSLEGQREAFLPVSESFSRKVVLATNIAETSVTVPGVRYVVDCGKAKVKQFRPRIGMESLLAKPISKSSAVQRTGRAGREGPGKCFRLYTEASFENLQKADLPEILRNDVLGAVLTMKARGIHDVLSFPLMDPPEREAIEKALVQLHFLGAVDDDGTITLAGKVMARLPVPATLSAVLLAARRSSFDCVLEAIDIISCITCGEDIFLTITSEEGREETEISRQELQRREGDLLTYLTTIRVYSAENSDRTQWCKRKKINIRNMKQAMNIRRQLRGICIKEKLLDEAPGPDPQPFTPLSPEKAELILRCFLRGFAYKTALLAPDGSFMTVYGKHPVAIHPGSVLYGQKKEAIMFLDHVFTNKSYAKKVSAIQASWIAEALEVK
ncbi:Helicase-associated domain protein [Moelleriella libera RCEF 2490]|uniref:RNA helicase n=1 Tax=Moelleriella libera RCEF 2490 TaxID=1081109 RepID=A0A166P7A3_9HYPO|nr:Helicase-associated domain protein [Moelleriella libera RCEF 2490]